MKTDRAPVEQGFGIRWALASTLGVAVAFFAVGANLIWGSNAGPVLGAAVGILQWLVLRRYISRAGWWVLASIVGGTVGLLIGYVGLRTVLGGPIGVHAMEGSSALSWVLGGAVLGLAVGASLGTFQWLVLRRHVVRAGQWMMASTLGWLIGMTVGVAVGYAVATAVFENNEVKWTVGWITWGIVGGAVTGAITARSLGRLLRQRLPAPDFRSSAMKSE